MYSENKRAADNHISLLEWDIRAARKVRGKLEDDLSCLKEENARLKGELQKITEVCGGKRPESQDSYEFSPCLGYWRNTRTGERYQSQPAGEYSPLYGQRK